MTSTQSEVGAASNDADLSTKNSEPTSIVQLAALEALRNGRTPLPLAKGTKQPLKSGWTTVTYSSEEELLSELGDPEAFGVRLGEGIVDVDLDSPEASAVASHLLPPTTCISGHASNPASHRWYRVTGENLYKKFADDKLAVLLEYRGTSGQQTMVPPSRHPSGEECHWEGPGRPWDAPTVAADELYAAVAATALAALLVRHWPAGGARHDATLALAGGLLRGCQDSAVMQVYAAKIVSAVSYCVDDEEAGQRVQEAIPSTVRRLESSAQVSGWTKLGTLLRGDTDKVLEKVMEFADELRKALGVTVVLPAKDGASEVGFSLTVTDSRRTAAGDVPSNIDPATGEVLDEEAGEQPAPARSVRILEATDIQMRPTHWLWNGRLPEGALSLVAGEPGRGKSTFVYSIVAKVTTGELPGSSHGTPRNVIVVATEESLSQVVVPRLKASGADLKKVSFVAVEEAGVLSPGLEMTTDLGALERAMRSKQAAMLVLDPLTSRLGAGLDTNKDSEVRRALEPLASLLDRVHAVGLGIMHYRKNESREALHLLNGSIAFGAVSRTVHVVDHDPERLGVRLFACIKNNLGKDSDNGLPMVSFTVESERLAVTTPTGVDESVEIGVARWLAGEDGRTWSQVQKTRRASEKEAEKVSNGVQTAKQEAKDFLRTYLKARGWSAPGKDIKEEAAAREISASTLRSARVELGIKVTKRDGFGGGTRWVWLAEARKADERRRTGVALEVLP